MRSFFVVSALVTLIGASWAQVPNTVRFEERPGRLEFSGELIAKPVPVEALARRGIVGPAAERIRQEARRRALANPGARYEPRLDWVIFRVPRGETESSYASKLLATGQYEYVEPNWRVYPATVPDDPLFGQQWHHVNIRSTEAWALHTGANVVLGIVDTGNDLGHPEFVNLYVPGYNARDRIRQVDGGVVTPFDTHGTHVAGCAAAHGNNGIGVAGVGWQFRVMPIRCMGANGAWPTWETLAEGAMWAVDNGARLVNMSWTGVHLPLARDTGAYVRSKGGLLFWAAGNDSRNLSNFDWTEVVVVGASTPGDGRAGFSAFGLAVDVFAPGEGIFSTLPMNNGGYGQMSGTSMATPVALGVAALIWSVNPNLTNEQVEEILFETCDPIGDPMIFGNGRVNSFRAVLRALQTLGVRADVSGFDVERGRHVSGTIGDLRELDGRSMIFAAGPITGSQDFPVSVVFSADVGSGAVTSLRTVFAGRVDSVNIAQSLELFDWTSNSYVLLDQRTGSLTDSVVDRLAPDPSRFVSASGEVRLRARYRANGPTSQAVWGAAVNQLYFVVQR